MRNSVIHEGAAINIISAADIIHFEQNWQYLNIPLHFRRGFATMSAEWMQTSHHVGAWTFISLLGVIGSMVLSHLVPVMPATDGLA